MFLILFGNKLNGESLDQFIIVYRGIGGMSFRSELAELLDMAHDIGVSTEAVRNNPNPVIKKLAAENRKNQDKELSKAVDRFVLNYGNSQD